MPFLLPELMMNNIWCIYQDKHILTPLVDFWQVCWVKNTYHLPGDGIVPGQKGQIKPHISYYQWVPLILLLQAFFFYLPCCFWRICADRSGINIENLVDASYTIQNALYPERRDKTIRYMVRHLDHYLDFQREYRGGCCVACKHFLARHSCMICGNRYGNYLMALYLLCKVLYFLNVIGQLFILNLFLQTDFYFYGIRVVLDLLRGSSIDPTPVFPLKTLCDFRIREMGNDRNLTVQCVLPINFFNEKIFLFLWFWFLFVTAITAFSMLRWIWTLGIRSRRVRYIRKQLKIMDRLNRDSDRDRKLSLLFVDTYLKQDGVLVLKLVAKNSTELVVADIVASLWDSYKRKPCNRSNADFAGESSGTSSGMHWNDLSLVPRTSNCRLGILHLHQIMDELQCIMGSRGGWVFPRLFQRSLISPRHNPNDRQISPYAGAKRGDWKRLAWNSAASIMSSPHYCNVIMGAVVSQVTSLTIVYLTVLSGGDQRKHQSPASLAFLRGIHRWPMNSSHKIPVTRKKFSFDDVIMIRHTYNI